MRQINLLNTTQSFSGGDLIWLPSGSCLFSVPWKAATMVEIKKPSIAVFVEDVKASPSYGVVYCDGSLWRVRKKYMHKLSKKGDE
jgi:hypothetical protein